LTGQGTPRLAPLFVEWLMGLDEGWVTDPALGLGEPEQLHALGNGVVPRQAVAALTAITDGLAQ
jgi:DNA (cytosine-5)-methyltransferase 1